MKNTPFLNPVLQVILHNGLFKGRTGLYNVFPDEFRGSGDKREMPAILVALAATYVSHVRAQRVSSFLPLPQVTHGPRCLGQPLGSRRMGLQQLNHRRGLSWSYGRVEADRGGKTIGVPRDPPQVLFELRVCPFFLSRAHETKSVPVLMPPEELLLTHARKQKRIPQPSRTLSRTSHIYLDQFQFCVRYLCLLYEQ